MSDDLDIRAKVTLEADEAASVKQIKSQIPSIESGLKNTRVKVPVEADTSNVVQEVQKAAKTAASSLKAGGKVLVPIDAAFNINLKDTNAVEKEVNRLIKQFTQNKGTLVDFKIKANGVNEANSIMLKYKNSAEETVRTMLKLVDVTQDLDNPQFAWQINSNDFEKNIAKYQKGLAAITEAERKTSGSYWQGQFKDSISGMTATNDELAKMREFYSEIETAASKAARTQQKTSKDYWQGRFKDSVGDITAQNSGLQDMAEYYKQVGKEADKAAKSANELKLIQGRAEGLKIDQNKSQVDLDWSLYDKAIGSGDIKQATVELQILERTYTNLSKAMRASIPNQSIENLPKRIDEAITSVVTLENAFNGLQSKGAIIPENVLSNLSKLKILIEDVKAEPKNQATLETFRNLSDQIDKIKLSLKETQSDMRFDNIVKGVERADVQLKRFQKNMLLLKKDWSAFTKDPELMKQFEALFSASQQSGAAQSLSSLNAQFGVLKTNIELAGKAQKTFIGRLAQNFSKFVSWFAIGGFTASAVRGFRDIFAAVKDVDTAMTSLRKVTDETDKTYSRFLTNASKKAVQLGASVSDLVSATTSFARLGYSIEDSYSLGQLATVYANVGDEVNGVEGATSSIISTLAGFKLGVQDATSVVDKFNNVGNNFAITSGGIGEALKRSASALHEAGADIDSSIALITGANTVVQDVDMVGTALKTSSLRLRGSTTELEDMGEDVDSFAKSTSLLRGELEALTGVDIMINDNQYKDIYTVYEEIAKVYDSLTDVSQANVLEILFGKRQANVGGAILSGWQTVASAYETSLDSEGSAAREYEKWLSSIEAKQQQAKAQFQAFSNAILDSDLIKFVYDSGTGILGFLTSITETLGSLPLLAATAAAALSFKNVG